MQMNVRCDGVTDMECCYYCFYSFIYRLFIWKLQSRISKRIQFNWVSQEYWTTSKYPYNIYHAHEIVEKWLFQYSVQICANRSCVSDIRWHRHLPSHWYRRSMGSSTIIARYFHTVWPVLCILCQSRTCKSQDISELSPVRSCISVISFVFLFHFFLAFSLD